MGNLNGAEKDNRGCRAVNDLKFTDEKKLAEWKKWHDDSPGLLHTIPSIVCTHCSMIESYSLALKVVRAAQAWERLHKGPGTTSAAGLAIAQRDIFDALAPFSTPPAEGDGECDCKPCDEECDCAHHEKET